MRKKFLRFFLIIITILFFLVLTNSESKASSLSAYHLGLYNGGNNRKSGIYITTSTSRSSNSCFSII